MTDEQKNELVQALEDVHALSLSLQSRILDNQLGRDYDKEKLAKQITEFKHLTTEVYLQLCLFARSSCMVTCHVCKKQYPSPMMTFIKVVKESRLITEVRPICGPCLYPEPTTSKEDGDASK